MSYKIIYCDGDSWTAGDILDPLLDTTYINHPDNDAYRLPKVWPHKLGDEIRTLYNFLGVGDINIVNKSVAGSSNDGIVRRTINNVLRLIKEVNPDELYVIIGWSSPERRDFYYNNRHWETLYPAELFQTQLNDEVQEFYKIYVKYFWNEEEYSNRYIEQVLLLHNFLKALGIKHSFFNAFYESSSGGNFKSLYDKYYKENVRGIPDQFSEEYYDELSNSSGIIDDVILDEYKKIYNDHYIKISFKSFCDKIESTRHKRFDKNHPVERMHTEWAKYLHKQIFSPKGYLYND